MSRPFLKPVKSRWNDALSRISDAEFERIVGAYYTGKGYHVEHSGTGNGKQRTDGGIDLKLYREGQYIVVQCKRWNAYQVAHNDVHQLIGVMHTQRATGAIVVTAGEFTEAAKRAAREFPAIQLIEGREVREMLGPVAEPVINTDAAFGDEAAWAAPSNRPDRKRKRGRAGRSWRVELAGLAASVVIAYGTYFYITHVVLKNLAANLTQPAGQPPGIAIKPVHTSPPGNASPSERAWLEPRATGANLVRAQAPAIIRADGTPVTGTVTPGNKKELQEWQRQNAESMRILEKTTPSLD